MTSFDVIVIGAGAAGLMCAQTAAHRGRRVLVLDHANKPGKKILLSGGGRCNFTHRHAQPAHYRSQNPHFAISALKRYTPQDFEQLVQKHRVVYHEKTEGQLFCTHSAKDILDLLLAECQSAFEPVRFQLNTHIKVVQKRSEPQDSAQPCYVIETSEGDFSTQSLVIATGGLSFPTMGASPFGYRVAEQFGIQVVPTRAGLVPFTLHVHDLARFSPLAGISVDVKVTCGESSFEDALLFTHRGLSGPAMLQISSYWLPGDELSIDFSPKRNVFEYLQDQKQNRPKSHLKTGLSEWLPARLVDVLCEENRPVGQLSERELLECAKKIHEVSIKPNQTEGYRTAEVTLGGVDTRAISSKTFECLKVKGLYFIGEVLDVTGQLGGYNFQWAWSSGVCCGQVV